MNKLSLDLEINEGKYFVKIYQNIEKRKWEIYFRLFWNLKGDFNVPFLRKPKTIVSQYEKIVKKNKKNFRPVGIELDYSTWQTKQRETWKCAQEGLEKYLKMKDDVTNRLIELSKVDSTVDNLAK